MECACTIDTYFEGGSASFCSEKIVTARKKHKCCECYRTINAGEKYEKVAGVWGGDFSTYKTCIDCVSVRNEFFNGGYIFENIWSEIKAHNHESQGAISEDCLVNLTPKSKSAVADIIEDYHNEHQQM